MTAKAAPMTTADVAAKLETTPKTLRRFLRATAAGVGAGSRYAFTAKDMPKLRKAFAAWESAQPAPRVRKAKIEKPAAEPKLAKAPTVKASKAADRARGEARAEALDNALKARGTHISQHRA